MKTARVENSQQQPRKYTTYERDANSSDEAMHRRYGPLRQRFDQPDPSDGSYDLADPQSFNRYAYVNNDPVNFVDPSGLQRTVCVVSADGNIVCNSGPSFPPLPGADRGFSAFGGWGGGFNFNARPMAGFGIISLRENASDPFFLAWSDPWERMLEIPFSSMFGQDRWGGLWGGEQERGPTRAKARVMAFNSCMERKKKEAERARAQYNAKFPDRVKRQVQINTARGALAGAVGGGVIGAGAGGVGAIPGAAGGAVLGGIGGFYSGAVSGVVLEPAFRAWHHRRDFQPALDRAKIECDIEADRVFH